MVLSPCQPSRYYLAGIVAEIISADFLPFPFLPSFLPVKLGTNLRGFPLSPVVLLKPTVLIRFLKPKLEHRAGLARKKSVVPLRRGRELNGAELS